LSLACLIINPAAGRGRIRARLPELRAIFSRLGITAAYETAEPGDEEELARRAISSGVETIVAVGGDGTCGRIANAIITSGAACRLAVVPSGTGNDFAKTLGVSKYTFEQIAELVVSGKSIDIDAGMADGYYFINSCGFGFDAAVLEASNDVRFLKGNAVYIYSALRQLVSYAGIEVSPAGVSVAHRGRMLMIIVSNGRWLGGAFEIAPQASVVDGNLDACFFSDSNVLERIRLFVGAMRGKHLGMPSVSAEPVRQLTLSFDSAQPMEMDGELRIARSRIVELRCVPRALAVIAAPGTRL
jgi:YegS/Rv2252/BmrU family lipid kinase